ncbi:hypothetical protein [Falsibacillus pallidus]|uniref:Uncharacterized protein n=1 Tax=Falsibacillus pallidus TaxID=493781 RepID=A0A370GF79_9BACI|nr:hypothetical protein [Falsibacillus pallidus]RDI41064.1 hypothetical protein DFR59_11067 [Falsibacillus pallidus]
MKLAGFIIISIGLAGLSILIAMCSLISYVDKLEGEYYTHWYKYLNFSMVFPLIIIFIMGVVYLFKQNKIS